MRLTRNAVDLVQRPSQHTPTIDVSQVVRINLALEHHRHNRFGSGRAPAAPLNLPTRRSEDLEFVCADVHGHTVQKITFTFPCSHDLD